MGLKLKIVAGVNSILSIVPSVETYTGVADFNNDSVTILDTASGGSDDFRIGAVFNWKMWLDTDTGFANDLFVFDNSSGGVAGHLQAWLFDSSLYIGMVGIAYNMYDISGFDNEILDCQVITDYVSYPYPHEFKINNVVQSGTNTVPSGHTDHSGVYIGEAITTVFGVTLDGLDNGTVWDVQTETSLGVITHTWAGYPAGNTLGAWEDTTGSLDATIVGPSATRDIVGVNPGSGSATGSVLLIAPPSAPVPGAPTLYRPLDTSTLGTVDPSLAWLSVSGADTYWVQLDDDPGFASLTYDVSGLAGLYYDVSALDTSTAYYWRAAATNASGTGSWSSEWEFYTPQAGPPEFPTAGLEAYWSFEEISGTVTDQTSNTNNLPTNSGVTYEQTGKIDDCVTISGSGYLQGTSDTVGTNVFSISAWVKTPDVADRKTIFACEDGPWNSGYNFAISTTGQLYCAVFASGAGDNITTNSADWDDDTWHHVVVTHNGGGTGSAINFYVDGSLQGKTGSMGKTPVSNVGGTFRIGNWTLTTDFGLNGEVDEMGVWSTVLSATDVSTLYNFGDGLAYPGP